MEEVYRLKNLTRDDILVTHTENMKTLIQTLFSGKRIAVKRNKRNSSSSLVSGQFAKMARLGQQLVVMSK